MEKPLRRCTACNIEAKTLEDLKLFVSDRRKNNNYFTKSICKSCNAKINREKRNGTYVYPDKSTNCKDCFLKPKDEKERESFFVKDKTIKSGYANLCKKCASARTMRHQKNNPEQFKKRLKRYSLSKYGITIEEYNKILKKQNKRCAICKTKAKDSNKSFSVDHNHLCCPGKTSCGSCVRGILCNRCNLMIGLSKDSPETLKHAIIYLRKGVSH